MRICKKIDKKHIPCEINPEFEDSKNSSMRIGFATDTILRVESERCICYKLNYYLGG